MAVSYAHGFNDEFNCYASGSDPTPTFDLVSSFNAGVVRTSVDWGAAEPAHGTYNWDGSPGKCDHYTGLILEAVAHGLKILPIVQNAPTNWLPHPGGWVQSGQNHPKPQPDTRPFAPTGPSLDYFGEFVVELLHHFDYFGVIDAVEIWNEPNLDGGIQELEMGDYKDMLSAAAAAVFDANQKDAFSHDMVVVSGGVAMGEQGRWKDYFVDSLKDQCVPIAAGIHPYPLSAEDSDEAVCIVKDLFNQAHDLVGNDLWVTETGCTSDPPFDLDAQASTLSQLCGSGGFFANRPRCKAVMIHNLLPLLHQEDSPQHGYFLAYPDGTVKEPAHTVLHNAWAP